MSATNGHTTINLLGRDWPVSLPLFVERQELVLAWSQEVEAANTNTKNKRQNLRIVRVLAAALGRCTGLGNLSKCEYDCDPLAYGGQVYSFLCERGAKPEEVRDAGSVVVQLLTDHLFPGVEAETQRDFSAPAEG